MIMFPSKTSGMEAIKMERLQVANKWLTSKYGDSVYLWQCEMNMKNMNGDSEG